jgi:hypothetical protein
MQTMEKQFEIRTYGFNELAQCYFPNITSESASVKFSRWIHTNPQLMEKLSELNWKKRSKCFTPKQVNVLIGHFDPP